MPRKNRRDKKDKMCNADKFADVHCCDTDDDLNDRDEDTDWLNNNY